MTEPEISADRLADIDQWHARTRTNLNGLIEAGRRDIDREKPVSRAVEAALLSATIRSHVAGRDALADLLAVLLVEVIRPVDTEEASGE